MIFDDILFFVRGRVHCVTTQQPLRNSPEHHPEGLHAFANSVRALIRFSRWCTTVFAVSVRVTKGWCAWPRFLDGLGCAADQYVALGSSRVMHICTQHSRCSALLSHTTHSNMYHGHTQRTSLLSHTVPCRNILHHHACGWHTPPQCAHASGLEPHSTSAACCDDSEGAEWHGRYACCTILHEGMCSQHVHSGNGLADPSHSRHRHALHAHIDNW